MKYLKNFLLPNKFKKKSFNFRQSLHQILHNYLCGTLICGRKMIVCQKRLKRANVVNKNQVLHFLKRHRLSTFHHLATKVIMSS